MPTKNHFAVLGIDLGAGENEVKRAYRNLAKKWHPDKNKDPGAKEKFQEIAASYEYLSSQDRREMLERELRRAAQQPPSHTQSTQPPPQQQTSNSKPAPTNTTKTSQSGPTFTTSSSSKPKPGSAKSNSKAHTSHWSESFTKNYRSQQQHESNRAGSKPSQKQAGRGRGGSGTQTFDFRSHVSTPSDQEEDMFEDLFGDFFNAMGFGGPHGLSGGSHADKPKAGRPRNVAPETGRTDGLDEEYLFSPRRGSNDAGEKIPCPWCGQLFTRGKLGQHEEKCGKFGLSAEEDGDDDDDEDDFFDSDNDTDSFSYYSSSSRQPTYPRRPSWQQKHEETRSKIRRDKMRHRDRMGSQGARNSGFITCPYCLREFNSEAGAKHMPWCKQHTERYGRPLNPKPTMPGTGQRHGGAGDGGGGAWRTGKGNSTTGGASSRRRDTSDFNGDRHGPFAEKEEIPSRTGNDQPFPTTGPKIPDMFNINGVRVGETKQPNRGPKVTIGLGRGPKISVGISSGSASQKFGNPTGPSAQFTAQAGRRPNGAFKVRFNLNANLGSEKPGSYTSSFQNRKR